MTRSYRSVLLCLLGLALTAPQASGGEGVFSGPQVGERLSPVKVAIAYGRKKGNEVDLLEAAEGRPTLLVFVHGANRPAARLTRALMNYAEMRADDGLFAALIWLADDLSGAEQYMERSISWWGVGLPVGISVDGAEGPGSYGLNRKVNVTVLVAKKNRVTANFALVQPSETDAPKILSEVVKLVGGKIPTAAEITFLSVPTRKPKTAKWLTAPPDLHFRRLICNSILACFHIMTSGKYWHLSTFCETLSDR